MVMTIVTKRLKHLKGWYRCCLYFLLIAAQIDRLTPIFSSKQGQAELRISKEKFLQNLPLNVVVNNEVVAVREELAAKVGVSKAQKAKRSVLAPAKRVSRPTVLHVRSEDGKETVVLELDYADTIGDAMRAIAQHRLVVTTDVIPLTWRISLLSA